MSDTPKLPHTLRCIPGKEWKCGGGYPFQSTETTGRVWGGNWGLTTLSLPICTDFSNQSRLRNAKNGLRVPDDLLPERRGLVTIFLIIASSEPPKSPMQAVHASLHSDHSRTAIEQGAISRSVPPNLSACTVTCVSFSLVAPGPGLTRVQRFTLGFDLSPGASTLIRLD
jgi:hypothetical protein